MVNELHLQGIGRLPAKMASEVKVGDVLSWNYSYKCCEVVAIEECGAKSVNITERYYDSGKEFVRRVLKTRLVAVA